MKFIVLIMALILTVSSCNAQNNEQQSNTDKQNEVQQSETGKQMDISFIDNEKINYGTALVACDNCAPIRSDYRVIVELTDEQYKIVQKLDKQTWLNLLNSPNSDFAANMILYDIYKKDAKILSLKDNLYESWKRYMKTEDLEYWEQYLIEIEEQINQIKVAAETDYKYEGERYEEINKLIDDYSKDNTINLRERVGVNPERLKFYEEQGKRIREDYLKDESKKNDTKTK